MASPWRLAARALAVIQEALRKTNLTEGWKDGPWCSPSSRTVRGHVGEISVMKASTASLDPWLTATSARQSSRSRTIRPLNIRTITD